MYVLTGEAEQERVRRRFQLFRAQHDEPERNVADERSGSDDRQNHRLDDAFRRVVVDVILLA